VLNREALRPKCNLQPKKFYKTDPWSAESTYSMAVCPMPEKYMKKVK